jgi:hypothetical protein
VISATRCSGKSRSLTRAANNLVVPVGTRKPSRLSIACTRSTKRTRDRTELSRERLQERVHADRLLSHGRKAFRAIELRYFLDWGSFSHPLPDIRHLVEQTWLAGPVSPSREVTVEDVYEGHDRKSGEPKYTATWVDLVFGSISSSGRTRSFGGRTHTGPFTEGQRFGDDSLPFFLRSLAARDGRRRRPPQGAGPVLPGRQGGGLHPPEHGLLFRRCACPRIAGGAEATPHPREQSRRPRRSGPLLRALIALLLAQ